MCHLVRLIESAIHPHVLFKYARFRLQRPQIKTTRKFLSQMDKDILSVAAILIFLALVQHTHALAHTQLPKHQTHNQNSQSEMFSLSSDLIKYDDGVFRWG